MNNMYDIQKLLIRYGSIIYTGNRLSDLKLMEIEIDELFQAKLLSQTVYLQAKSILKKEICKSEQEKRNGL